MQILVIILALVLLMAAAYRGWSVILFAPIPRPSRGRLEPGASTGSAVHLQVFMAKMVVFVQLYFPVFLLALFSES